MIDIKEIRIGNHVANKKGERVKVTQLPCEMHPLMLCLYENGTDGVIGYPSDFEPIPLTAELLTELGFEQRSDEREWHKYIGEAWIGIHLFLDRERMRVYVCDDSVDYGNLIVRYLHELENFAYLTLHKELIAE